MCIRDRTLGIEKIPITATGRARSSMRYPPYHIMVASRPPHRLISMPVSYTHLGDLSSRVEVSGEDEVGQLADSFNLMADTLERSETRRREFVANVSHELKTPMTTISGFADGILDGTIPKEKEMEYIAVISSETHRLSRLVRGMLDVYKRQAL